MAADLAFHTLAGKRLDPGQTFVQNTRQRVDVGARIITVGGEPLGRHVGQGADRGAGAGELGRLGRTRDPEVDEVREIVLCHEDVRWFDVAVHQPDAVGCAERGGDLFDDRDGALRRHRAVGYQLIDGLAVDQPHRDVEAAVDLAEIVDRDDVGLVQAGRCLRLPAEPGLVLRIVGEVRG